MQNSDFKTTGYVMRRTNYGEADRIIDLITPLGKFAVLAKGVRKEKSRLAGGIEMFTRSEVNIHCGRGNLAVLTGARMQKFHSGIIRNYARLELAAEILKRVDKAAEGAETDEYFRLIDQSLTALGEGERLELVETWFRLNLLRIMGEELNLYRDSSGKKLAAEQHYRWDNYEKTLVAAEDGEFGASEIKFLRLIESSDLALVRRVKVGEGTLAKVWRLAREVI